jgi:hypothetical protein
MECHERSIKKKQMVLTGMGDWFSAGAFTNGSL